MNQKFHMTEPRAPRQTPVIAPSDEVNFSNHQSAMDHAFDVKDLSVWYGQKQTIFGTDIRVPAKSISAIIGPSGCGKSTFLRCLNRMHELVPNGRMEGSIRLFGEDLYAPKIDPCMVRRRVGMVFQKSNPFPTMSIADNVIVGLRLN